MEEFIYATLFFLLLTHLFVFRVKVVTRKKLFAFEMLVSCFG